MAECQLPKLNTRVRFPYPAPEQQKNKMVEAETGIYASRLLITGSRGKRAMQNPVVIATTGFCLVDDNGLEPLTLRTSSGCSTS